MYLEIVTDRNLVAQVLTAFFPESGQKIEQLDPKTEQYQRAKKVETAFTAGVAFLRAEAVSEQIRSMAADVWDICHHRHVVLALGPAVKTFSFAAFKRGGSIQALLLPPLNWVEMIEADPVLQLGAIVMAGSQAVDFYNRRFETDLENVQKRARAFEAELLLAFRETALNDYQKGILKEYPFGMDPGLLYPRRKVVGPS